MYPVPSRSAQVSASCTEVTGKESGAIQDPGNKEGCLEEEEPELSLEEPLGPGRFGTGSECEFRWQ